MENTSEKAKRYITPALVFHTDITVKSASGIYVEGTDGKRYMDFTSGLATANLGHCPPEVVKAVKAQMEKLIHSGCIFYYDSEADLAEKLSEITPEGIEKFFFSNSGAEAVEGAIKLARFTTKRQGVIAFTGSFHGRTLGALSLTASASKYRRGYHPLLPSVYHAPYPFCYRCPMGHSRDECATDCFDYFMNLMRFQISPDEIACVVMEPVLGEGGYAVPPKEYLVKLRKFCDEHGIMLILDEVQSGFGRTGKWFASEHFNIKPDILVMAKGIASGFPLSAFGSSAVVMDNWPPGAHGTTFGGNPVSCAAALATINSIIEKGALENAAALGEYALKKLLVMKVKYPFIGDVRGLGLMIGIEFVNDDLSPATDLLMTVIKKCMKNGLIMVECGVDKNVARLMPPLTTTKEEMDCALEIFEGALN